MEADPAPYETSDSASRACPRRARGPPPDLRDMRQRTVARQVQTVSIATMRELVFLVSTDITAIQYCSGH